MYKGVVIMCNRILKPSQIGAVLPLDNNVVLVIDGKRQRVNSTNLIDSFLFGEYDNYEITCISTEKYGWLKLDLATIE